MCITVVSTVTVLAVVGARPGRPCDSRARYVFSDPLYFLSPKGSNTPAQGERSDALGTKAQFAKALKGRYMPADSISPFQGCNDNDR